MRKVLTAYEKLADNYRHPQLTQTPFALEKNMRSMSKKHTEECGACARPSASSAEEPKLAEQDVTS